MHMVRRISAGSCQNLLRGPHDLVSRFANPDAQLPLRPNTLPWPETPESRKAYFIRLQAPWCSTFQVYAIVLSKQ